MAFIQRATKFIRGVTPHFARPFSSLQKSEPSDDLNHVILLGTVNAVTRSSNPDKKFAFISLRTRDVYRTAKGYGMKVVSHRIHVFRRELFEKAIQLNKGDRICIHGYLGSFLIDPARTKWLHCVVARSICPYLNPPDDLEEQTHSEDHSTKEPDETTEALKE